MSRVLSSLVIDGKATVSVAPSNSMDLTTKQYVDGRTPVETDAQHNTSYGLLAQNVISGSENTAIGENAQKNIGAGILNVAVGSDTQVSGTGTHNVAVGTKTQYSLNGGTYNIGIGFQTQYYITSGNNNIAIGANSMRDVNTGYSNVGVGTSTLLSVTTGISNVGIGSSSLYSPNGLTANATTIASYQTAIGMQSGAYAAGTGDELVAIGFNAIAHTKATAIGATSKAQGTNSVAIGYGAIATLNNQIMLGTATERVYVNNDPVANLEVATKQYVDTRTPKITVASSAPSSPAVNDLWVDTT